MQRRLDELLEGSNILCKLNEAAESCAALGDVYGKVNWDRELADYGAVRRE